MYTHIQNDAHLLMLASPGPKVAELLGEILFLLAADVSDHGRGTPAIHAMASLTDRFRLCLACGDVRRIGGVTQQPQREGHYGINDTGHPEH